MDVVIYSVVNERNDSFSLSSAPQKGLMLLGAVEENGKISPLSVWTAEPAFRNSLEFLVHEDDRPGLAKEAVTVHSVLDQVHVSYGSRQVGGGMGPGNPHGEESEMLYYVDQVAINSIELLIRPELEIFW
jgi:hypothetical protein